MSMSRAEVKSAYPLPVYNYRLTFLFDGTPSVIGFSEVSGLVIDYQPITYKHGLSYLTGAKIVPGMRQPIKVTLKKGLTQHSDFVLAWFKRCHLEPWSSAKRSDILIDLCDESGLAVIRWKLIQAMPTQFSAPTLTANSNESAVASMELVSADLMVEYPQS